MTFYQTNRKVWSIKYRSGPTVGWYRTQCDHQFQKPRERKTRISVYAS